MSGEKSTLNSSNFPRLITLKLCRKTGSLTQDYLAPRSYSALAGDANTLQPVITGQHGSGLGKSPALRDES
jgi:hypothetical protein